MTDGDTSTSRVLAAGSDSETADREIVTTRTFDAPRDLVFRVWTEPQHIAQWWGPRGFTNTVTEMDVRPGGIWRVTMHGPDGNDYPNKIVYREVVSPERLVYEHGDEDGGSLPFHVTVTFSEPEGKTRVTMRALFASTSERNRVVEEVGAIEGAKQTFDRLEEHLANVHRGQELLIERDFNAPRDLVFRAWTEPERLARWWGPKSCSVEVASLDLRPGGDFHYRLVMPGGQEMWGKFIYKEIAPPERLVFVSSFSDQGGGITRSPFSDTWPLQILNTLTLAEHDGRTTLTLRGGPYGATDEEREAFEAMLASMQMGFKGTFDQLADYLADLV